MISDRFPRREPFPVRHHGILYPTQINGVVDMTQMVDVIRADRYGLEVGTIHKNSLGRAVNQGLIDDANIIIHIGINDNKDVMSEIAGGLESVNPSLRERRT